MQFNFTDPKKQLNTQLVLAAKSGNLLSLEDAIEKKADVNYVDKGMGTALYLAARNGILSVVEKLIAHKADVNLAYDKKTPIMAALENNHIQIVTLLLKNGAIFGLDEQLVAHNVTDLIARCAALTDLLSFLETLTNCGLTDRAIIKLLPDKFANFSNKNIKEDIYDYLSHHHIPEDRIRVCEDALNPAHPLGYIIHLERRSYEWGANLGIKKDIDVLMQNAKKNLAKMPANDNDLEMPDIVKKAEPAEEKYEDDFLIMDVAYDHGILFRLNDPTADRNSKEKNIFDAIKLEDLTLIDQMIAQDEKVLNRWVNCRAYSPLQYAIMEGNPEVVKHLLKNKANKDYKNRYNEIPLLTAIYAEKLEIVKLLVIDEQVDPFQRNPFGNNTFHVAAQSRVLEMKDFFLKLLDPARNKKTRICMLGIICSSLKNEQNGQTIIETLEMLKNNQFSNRDICEALRIGFSGHCKDQIKLNILVTIKASKALPDQRIYKKRMANIQNVEHPLACIMSLTGTAAELLFGDTMFWSVARSKSRSGKMLEQMLKEDELEDFVLLCDSTPHAPNSSNW